MIEFYYRHFKKNYTAKVQQLIKDIEKLLELSSIGFDNHIDKTVLPSELAHNLNKKDWEKINQLYSTLYNNEKRLPSVLKKFINKKDNRKETHFRFIDTFAGCGGLSLGLDKAGFNAVYVNEIEPKYLESYYFNHNISLDNYYCGDIKNLVDNINSEQDIFKDIDLIVGGPPCQGFSMANRQRIIDDPRNKLYKYYLQLLNKVRPKFFIMENVKGMMNKTDEIKDNFHELLGDDYSIEIVLLNAKDFGIPQNRERVFVIGSRLNNVRASKIVIDILNERGKRKSFRLQDALSGLPELLPKRIKNSRDIENEEIGFKFRKTSIQKNAYSSFINSVDYDDYIYNHTNRYNNDRDIEIFNRLPQGANSLHPSIADIMPYNNRNHIFKDKYFKLDESKVSKTITSHMKFDCNMYIHPTQPRGLSPREAARLQTFPDDFVFMGANNYWYAQIGNAVPVKLAEIIGQNIIKYLR